jgi:hypothetical protein
MHQTIRGIIMSETTTLSEAVGNLSVADGTHLNRSTLHDLTPEGVMRQAVPELRRVCKMLYGASIIVHSGESCESAGAILWGATEDLDRLATLISAAVNER